MRYRATLTLLAFLACALAPGARAQGLLDFLTAFDKAGPADLGRFQALLEPTNPCVQSDPRIPVCVMENGVFSGVRVKKLLYDGRGPHPFIHIDQVGPCLPMADFKARFTPGHVPDPCGLPDCPIWESRRPWGKILAMTSIMAPGPCVVDFYIEWSPVT